MAPILAAYGLSGCDVVCSCCGTGKNIVINVLNKKNIDLSSLGFLHQLLDNYLKQGNCLFVCFFALFWPKSSRNSKRCTEKDVKV